MSLFVILQQVGGRLGLMSVAAPKSAAPTPSKIATRTIPLAELVGEVKSRQLGRLAAGEAWLAVPKARIHAQAGVVEGGMSAPAVAERLRQPDLVQLPRDAAQVALLNELAKAKVRVEDVVRDAVARDQAMDAFAEQVRVRLAKARGARRRRREQIAAAQRQLAAEDAELATADERDDRAWAQWWQGKLADEREFAWTISHLVDIPSISVDDRIPPIEP
jgi:hypothetical protein